MSLTRPFPTLGVLSAAALVSHVTSAFAADPVLAAAPDRFTAALSQGPLAAAVAALLGGLLVSLTPCVYPMVAVTVSVFGAKKSTSRLHGALLSLAFVAGIVAMFTPLGVVAGLTGSVFGSVLQSPWVVVGISVLFLAMAASLFGAFDFALPSALTNRLAEVGGVGYKGAFLLGLVCGVIAAPCTGPVLTGILTFIAQTQSAALGAAAMLAFSLGLGAPFFVVGTFAVQLPKSGRWMLHVKSLLGIVLIVVALYFLSTTFHVLTALSSPRVGLLVAFGLLAVVGLALGAIHRDFAEPGFGNRIAKGLGVTLTSGAVFLLITGASKPTRTLSWETKDVAQARARALTEQRPLLVDFTAAWCVACKELEKLTFAEPRVAAEAGRFVAVRVDATDDEDPAVEAHLQRFNVVGLPTVIIYDSTGREAARFTDFVAAEPFLEVIKQVN